MEHSSIDVLGNILYGYHYFLRPSMPCHEESGGAQTDEIGTDNWGLYYGQIGDTRSTGGISSTSKHQAHGGDRDHPRLLHSELLTSR